MTNGEEHEDKTEPVWEGTPETNKAGVWAIRIQCEEGEVTLGDAVEVHSRSGGHWPARVVEIERAWRGGCLAIVTPPAWSGEEYVGPEEQLGVCAVENDATID